jgi:hypothetical protein
MSLETQVADLVTATNSLTGTVNTKIADIDSAKNTAVAAMDARVGTFNSTDLPAMQGDVNTLIASPFTGIPNIHFGAWEQRIGYGTQNGGTLDADHNGNGTGEILGSLPGFSMHGGTTTGFEHLGYVRDNVADAADRTPFEVDIMNSLGGSSGVTRYPGYSRGAGGIAHVWRMHIDTLDGTNSWGYYPGIPGSNLRGTNPVAWGGLFRLTHVSGAGEGASGAGGLGGVLGGYDTSALGTWQFLNYDYGSATNPSATAYTYSASSVPVNFKGYLDFFLPYMVTGRMGDKKAAGASLGLYMENKNEVR